MTTTERHPIPRAAGVELLFQVLTEREERSVIAIAPTSHSLPGQRHSLTRDCALRLLTCWRSPARSPRPAVPPTDLFTPVTPARQVDGWCDGLPCRTAEVLSARRFRSVVAVGPGRNPVDVRFAWRYGWRSWSALILALRISTGCHADWGCRAPYRASPGGGVHGVCGHSAARAALRSVGLTGWPRPRPNRAVLSLTLRW